MSNVIAVGSFVSVCEVWKRNRELCPARIPVCVVVAAFGQQLSCSNIVHYQKQKAAISTLTVISPATRMSPPKFNINPLIFVLEFRTLAATLSRITPLAIAFKDKGLLEVRRTLPATLSIRQCGREIACRSVEIFVWSGMMPVFTACSQAAENCATAGLNAPPLLVCHFLQTSSVSASSSEIDCVFPYGVFTSIENSLFGSYWL
jgi:hypothetical protein